MTTGVLTAADALADLLDKRHGAGVTDSTICAALTQLYEQHFHADMLALNVRRCNVCRR